MQVYRIARARQIRDLSGSGAKIYGWRWNHKGTSLIYTSESRALAIVEYLVHVPLSVVPPDLRLAVLQIPEDVIPREIAVSELPDNWREYPAPSALAEIGTTWIRTNSALMLRVPSAVVEHEFNALINPLHPDMKYVTIHQIERPTVDRRLLRIEQHR